MIKKYLNEVWEDLLWQGMEAVLYGDGDIWVRQQNSTFLDEDVIYKLPLTPEYWSDSYFMYKNEDGDLMKDESMKEGFIEDMTRQIKEGY